MNWVELIKLDVTDLVGTCPSFVSIAIVIIYTANFAYYSYIAFYHAHQDSQAYFQRLAIDHIFTARSSSFPIAFVRASFSSGSLKVVASYFILGEDRKGYAGAVDAAFVESFAELVKATPHYHGLAAVIQGRSIQPEAFNL